MTPMPILSIVGILTIAFLGLLIYLFASYPKRVYKLVCNTAAGEAGPAGTMIFAGTIRHNENKWAELVIRLRSDGLEARAAAVVAAAWVRDRIPECESQQGMQSMVSYITMLLREDLQKRLAQGMGYSYSMDTAYIKLDSIMRREGITICE